VEGRGARRRRDSKTCACCESSIRTKVRIVPKIQARLVQYYLLVGRNVNGVKMMSKSSLFCFVRRSSSKTSATVTHANYERFLSNGGFRPPSYREQYSQGIPFGRRQLYGKEQQLALQAVVGTNDDRNLPCVNNLIAGPVDSVF
jgi:hypothetical protein